MFEFFVNMQEYKIDKFLFSINTTLNKVTHRIRKAKQFDTINEIDKTLKTPDEPI